MVLKNKLSNLRNTPSPQIVLSGDDHEPAHGNVKHQGSSSSLAKFFNRSRASSSTSLNNMLSNESGSRPKKKNEMIESLQYNKSSILSPKISQSSANSSCSQKSRFSNLVKKHNKSPDDASIHQSSSKLELKRFFKNVMKPTPVEHLKDKVVQHHQKHHHSHEKTKQQSRSQEKARNNDKLAQEFQEKMLFGAETSQELVQKYGVPGKILGEGAGGSVAIVERPSDGKIFAVKQFRAKNAKESDYDYQKKVQSEFFIGSTLHHENIIETFDMLQEGMKFLVVMEYCPYDFFTLVMSGLLQKSEIACYFKQIVHGVSYLHSMGLAHRDLKLDNCVVTGEGILKLIDFGSAVVFKYPFEDEIIKAKGIVGSDPYLAPEVLSISNYDARPVDIWSIAIIFCCMTLKRFPWKVPKLSDPSYKAFTQTPANSQKQNDANDSETTLTIEALKNPDHELSTAELHELQLKTNTISNSTTTAFAPRSKNKGPYRLLRLLPHSSRPLIGAMLELDPKKRISIDNILGDEWFTQIQICHHEGETFHKATNHDHHLVTEEELTKIQEERERQKKIEQEQEKMKAAQTAEVTSAA